jgi:hypothetical protein
MSEVLALSGRKGSGKDEAAKALIADGWVRVAFADPLREMLAILDPMVERNWWGGPELRWTEILASEGYDELKQIPEARRLMQVFGTEVIRNHFGQNAWVDLAVNKIEALTDDGHSVVITDCRFPNEASTVRGLLAGRVVEIHRPDLIGDDAHVSEAGLPEGLIDVHLTNDGSIADLHTKIREIASS